MMVITSLILFIATGAIATGTNDRCLCSCAGNEASAILAGNFESTGSDVEGHYKGEKGAVGPPGKMGPRGPVGPQGVPGIKGERGETPAITDFSAPGSYINPAKSCRDLQRFDVTDSGFYFIKPDEFSSPFEVFCDLESAGGGWTLVASVHENNIGGKCSPGDLWSSEQGSIAAKYNETSNWQNKRTFGTASSATSADYKSPAYFGLRASNVMIWHVPNEGLLFDIQEQAYLRYYTDTGFLGSYGHTLHDLFDKHYPMKKVVEEPKALDAVSIEILMAALVAKEKQLTGAITNFYNYEYDGDVNQEIKDGGNDMFDNGNKVYFGMGNDYDLITYGEVYRPSHQIQVMSSSSSHPFQFLMWIGNEERSISTFQLKVVSGTGADGDGSYQTLSNNLSFNNIRGYYQAYNVYGASDPSICEVFYYVGDTRNWNSILPGTLSRKSWPASTDSLTNIVEVNGSPKNILMGYTLLSKASGELVTQDEIESSLLLIMKTVQSAYQISFQEPLNSHIKSITSILPSIRQSISSFYEYTYDDSNDLSISDGGSDMFDGGNKIYYKIGSGSFNPVTYGLSYSDASKQIQIASLTLHPFQYLMWIGNHDRSISSFQLKVVSETGADGSGSYATYSGSISQGNFRGYYQAFNVYGVDDPSISEVFYYIGNTQDWESVLPNSLSRETWPSETNDINIVVQVNGSPKNIILGYTLLSKTSGTQVSRSEVTGTLDKIMRNLTPQESTNERISCNSNSLSVPITYLTGNNNTIVSGIPPTERRSVTPGFIQFHPNNENGSPNAICPGVKPFWSPRYKSLQMPSSINGLSIATSSCRPQRVCIGGINTMESDPKSCGDFAGWEGENSDSPTATSPSGSAKSLNDINSSILIFTRE